MLDRLARVAASLASKNGDKARLTILIYHRVVSEPDFMAPNEPDVVTFTWQMEVVRRNFRVLALQEAVRHLKHGTLPPRALCVTFDDGYADNYSNALPVLKKLGLCATFFVATDFINGGRMWNDTVLESLRGASVDVLDLRDVGLEAYSVGSASEKRRSAMSLIAELKYREPGERERLCNTVAERSAASLPEDLMLTTEQLAAINREGMAVGGHTAGHPILARLSVDQARKEIVSGKKYLEEVLGKRVDLFAYPNGQPGEDYTGQHVRIVREAGFDAAVATCWGVSSRETDVYQLPRFTPWDATPTRWFLRLLRNYYQA